MVVTLSLWRCGGHLTAVGNDQGGFSHIFMAFTAVFLWVWVPVTKGHRTHLGVRNLDSTEETQLAFVSIEMENKERRELYINVSVFLNIASYFKECKAE